MYSYRRRYIKYHGFFRWLLKVVSDVILVIAVPLLVAWLIILLLSQHAIA
ncbi:hypothetical protein [Zooshikella harenae]|uniref:Sugar transferase n=1 Tax=Zooshikella harenae TaxID=2827238 RepID=A0ABS5ZC51_9GAMM|nr:hypothetical protein [Zooshikella harenae]MBU2710835.1 hypothetical protein [Zooshikella harenae]